MACFPDPRVGILLDDRRGKSFPMAGDIEIFLVENQLVGATDGLPGDESPILSLSVGIGCRRAMTFLNG